MNIHLLSLLVFLRDVCAGCRPSTPVFDGLAAEWDEAAELLADLAAVETVEDFLYICGGDA